MGSSFQVCLPVAVIVSFLTAPHLVHSNYRVPFAPQVIVVSPSISDEIRALADAGEVTWRQSEWTPDVAYALDGDDVVLACTDDAALNDAICTQCREAGVLVNICSDHTKCDFYFPGIVRRGNVTVAVNASGRDHARARELRERIEELLDEEGVTASQ